MAQQSLFDIADTPEFFSLTGETIGVDEVGRGPLIGDVVASAVILPSDCNLPLRDSKKLSEKKRNQLAEQIKTEAIAYAICVATPEEIDELNILKATMLAMQRAVTKVRSQVDKVSHIYIDGNRCPDGVEPCQFVIKGDDKVAEISAASILAKVYRDEQMQRLHEHYPLYGFDKHKGYPTALHLSKIEELGLIPGYRKSFKPVQKLLTQVVG